MTEPDREAASLRLRSNFGSLGSILALLMALWAVAIATFPLNDNSFFTHLATGRIILDERAVPSSDPYTFTAFGEPWTVQSWLASVVYATAERAGGDSGLRFVLLVTYLVALGAIGRLISAARSVLPAVALLGAAVLVFTEFWGERPYMVGVIGLAFLWLGLEGQLRSPWLLVPYMWLWVNWHGSFVFAPLLLLCYCGGAFLDRMGDGGRAAAFTPTERQVCTAVVGGIGLGVLGPLGLRALAFPFTSLSKRDSLSQIIEWQPPTYTSIAEVAFLVLFLGTVGLLLRRPEWRLAAPAIVFGASAFVAQRNIVMATVICLAVAARKVPVVGSLRSDTTPPAGRAMAAVLVAAFVALAFAALATPAIPSGSLGGYPATAFAWATTADLDGRLAGPVELGNLREVIEGPRKSVFIDDRVDMFPTEVVEDALRTERGQTGWRKAIEGDIDAVLWDRGSPVSSLVAADPGWRIIFSDPGWVFAVRR